MYSMVTGPYFEVARSWDSVSDLSKECCLAFSSLVFAVTGQIVQPTMSVPLSTMPTHASNVCVV